MLLKLTSLGLLVYVGCILAAPHAKKTESKPRDDVKCWPSPSEVMEWGKTELKGSLIFPGALGYKNAGRMVNPIHDSNFAVVAMVNSTEDVQKCILYCARHGFPPTVKSGGHDYVGRSAGHHTFSINLDRMKGLQVNLEDELSPTGASITVEPGNRWTQVYKKVDEFGYIVVGASGQNVSPGGYTTGGGHSPMSRLYGLNVDNTLAFTLVTPEGHIVKASKNGGQIQRVGETDWQSFDDTDLFWAVRGGGGGSFGVVTSYTYQIYKAPEHGFCHYFSYYPIFHPLFGQVGDKVIEAFSDIYLHNLTNNWGGYLLMSGAGYGFRSHASFPKPIPELKGHIFMSLLHLGDCDLAQDNLDLLKGIYPQYTFAQAVTNYSTFWEYEKGVTDPMYFRVYMINRLLQPEDLKLESGFGQVIVNLTHIKNDIGLGVGCIWTLIGGKVGDPPMDSAVSPDFRTSPGALTCTIGWESETEDEDKIATLQEYGEQVYKFGQGTYYNEPDYYLENWKVEYWGSMDRYNKLVDVKKKWDPKHIFTCHKCVASDIDY